MADDSLNQTVQDNQTSTTSSEDSSSSSISGIQQTSTPVTSGDQSAGLPTNTSVDEGTDPIRPVSTIPADPITPVISSSPPADDSSHFPVVLPSVQTPVETGSPPSVLVEQPVQSGSQKPADIPSPIIDSGSPDPIRPVSTIPADSTANVQQPEVKVDATPADSPTSDLPPVASPVSPVSDDTSSTIPTVSIPEVIQPVVAPDISSVDSSPGDNPQVSSSDDVHIQPKVEEKIPSLDSNRPVSTIPADSVPVIQQPEVSVDTKSNNSRADLPTPADSLPSSVSPSISPSPLPSDSLADTQVQEDVSVKDVLSPPVSSDIGSLSDVSTPSNLSSESKSDTTPDTGTPQNQVPQVQSEVPKDTSISITDNLGGNSAGIPPEPPDSPQIAPTEEKNSGDSNNLSFGDILSGQTDIPSSSAPVQAPVSEQPTPSVSFGDLIDGFKPKDISYDTVIPPTPSVPSDNPQPAVDSPQPPSAQQPQPSPPPSDSQTTSPSPVSPNLPDPIIIEKPVEVIKEVIKEVPVEKVVEKIVQVPVVDELEVNRRTEERISQEVDSRLQKATQKRIEKREENLIKILQYIQSKSKVNNNDIRDYLRVSQTTATEYLHTLVESGKIRMEGKGKATIYHL